MTLTDNGQGGADLGSLEWPVPRPPTGTHVSLIRLKVAPWEVGGSLNE
jgi:hypothetical protein